MISIEWLLQYKKRAKCVYKPKLFISYALNLLNVPFFSWILNTFSFLANQE